MSSSVNRPATVKQSPRPEEVLKRSVQEVPKNEFAIKKRIFFIILNKFLAKKKATKQKKILTEEEAIEKVQQLRNRLHQELLSVLELEQKKETEREELLKNVIILFINII